MDAPVQVGEVVAGKYEVERELARGGVGVVVKAKHLTLLEPCALKLMLPDAREDPQARQRFLREARAYARLKSEYVVKVFDVGELADATPFMVLEYLEGLDLDDYVRDRPLAVGEAALYVLQICAALAEAHAHGMVHRDLKPANVFLTSLPDGRRRIKLLDFGISKVPAGAGADQATTLDGTIMGTPYFMAPEQISGHAVDARTDVWALGVLFYYLLTARLPFVGDTPTQTMARILTTDPVGPKSHAPDLPPELDALILRCLERAPKDRPESVLAIADAVAPFAADEGAPISTHVRRILESAADGRLSSPGLAIGRMAPRAGASWSAAPTLSTLDVTLPEVPASTPGSQPPSGPRTSPPSSRGASSPPVPPVVVEPQNKRLAWMVSAGVAAAVVVVAMAAVLAPRAPPVAPVANAANAGPLAAASLPRPQAPESPAPATSAPSPTATAEPPQPSAKASASAPLPATAPPPPSASPHLAPSSRSAGFDLGVRR